MNYLLYVAILMAMLSNAANSVLVSAQPTNAASVLEALRKKHNLFALAIVVVKDGKICDWVAVGVRKLGDFMPVTTNDLFHIGSCTKSMTATLAALFVEEGKLQ